MKFSFTAKIYKVGINACVAVPLSITNRMKVFKGYIPVKGKINGFEFLQTLVPIKGAEYRLYVNGLMLKGGNAKVGDTLKFIIEQDLASRLADDIPMPKEFKNELAKNKLQAQFNKLIPSRRKDILKYLNNLKTKEALLKNISKVIGQLKDVTDI